LNVIDTHAHLDMPEFDTDRAEVIERARCSGVNTIITIGIDIASDQKAIALAENNTHIWAAVGIHPQESKNITKQDIENLAKLSRNPRVVALGELGLDYFRDYSPHETQIAVLHSELDIARNIGLPIIIHCRQAQQDMLPILQDWCASYPKDRPRGVIHCFSGDIDIANKYIDMGFFISLGAYIGYPSSAQLRTIISEIPLDRVVVETDSPFLPPQKYRGKRNEPAYVITALNVLAEVKQMSLDEIALQTTINANKVFLLNENNSDQ
jgi:TatD DNase family protein